MLSRLLPPFLNVFAASSGEFNPEEINVWLRFFGFDHVLLGTDMPFGGETGAYYVRETIRSVEEMAIPEDDKRKIFEDNPRRLFHLPVEV